MQAINITFKGDLGMRCMQILENVIKHRWGAIDDTQRAGIRNFVSNLIIKLSSDEQLFRQEKVYLNKLNIALVQVRQFTQISCSGIIRYAPATSAYS